MVGLFIRVYEQESLCKCRKTGSQNSLSETFTYSLHTRNIMFRNLFTFRFMAPAKYDYLYSFHHHNLRYLLRRRELAD